MQLQTITRYSEKINTVKQQFLCYIYCKSRSSLKQLTIVWWPMSDIEECENRRIGLYTSASQDA